jgi:hypothetical protein
MPNNSAAAVFGNQFISRFAAISYIVVFLPLLCAAFGSIRPLPRFAPRGWLILRRLFH